MNTHQTQGICNEDQVQGYKRSLCVVKGRMNLEIDSLLNMNSANYCFVHRNRPSIT